MNTLKTLLVAAALAATPAVAGSPWISIELPANQSDPATRGAFAVVRTYRHEQPMPYLVVGTAEGLVAGQRRSQPMTVRPTNETGRMAIIKTWPNDGVWVLKLGVEGMEMSAAIGIGTDGDVAFVRVPTTREGAPRSITRSEVGTLLRALAGGERVPQLAASR
jgi:hypothetical protein